MKNVGPCATCKSEVWIPDELHDAARRSEKVGFFCSYGHSLCFRQGETELEKMRRDRDRLAQQIAYKDDRLRQEREAREAAERQRAAARGQVTKIKNRVGHGVCPCCNRTFENVARHMASQHPTFTAEAAE